MSENGARNYSLFLSGDSLGFENIVRQYRNSMILFIWQFVRDYQAAEDISQDVFVKIYVKKPRYTPRASFKTWLYIIAKREAIDFLRKHKSTQVPQDNSGSIEDDYLGEILLEERKIALHHALNELNPEYRRVLYLLYFEELSVNEISILLNKKPRQISDMLYNAKKALAAIIQNGGGKYEVLRTDNP